MRTSLEVKRNITTKPVKATLLYLVVDEFFENKKIRTEFEAWKAKRAAQ